VKWFGNGSEFGIVDTTGWLDTDNRTFEHAYSMVKTLNEEVKYINCFVLTMKFADKIVPHL
jgi:hypothetical protein